MIFFKDRTFCLNEDCAKFGECSKALTDGLKAEAVKWWGGEDYPISVFAEKPDCWESVQNSVHNSGAFINREQSEIVDRG